LLGCGVAGFGAELREQGKGCSSSLCYVFDSRRLCCNGGSNSLLLDFLVLHSCGLMVFK
jgi:hypothetical protein